MDDATFNMYNDIIIYMLDGFYHDNNEIYSNMYNDNYKPTQNTFIHL